MTAKKIVLGVLGVLALLVAGLLVAASTRPDTYAVRRSRVVAAPPERIAPYLTDLRQWITWNPWDEMEPSSRKEYSDPASGVGAWYTWQGEKVGAGKMQIAAITPLEVRYDLHFTAPMEDDAKVVIALEPEGAGTKVTWSMDGNNNLLGKVFGLFVDMDAMIGADFEKGLGKLDAKLAAPAG